MNLQFINIIRKETQKKEPSSTILGTLGKGIHIATFKKEDFKPELAPTRAKISEFNVDGQDYVRMVY